MEENLYMKPFKTAWLRVKDYLHGPDIMSLKATERSEGYPWRTRRNSHANDMTIEGYYGH